MDEKVDQVIPKNMESPDIEVQRKSEIGEEADASGIAHRKELNDSIQRKSRDMDRGIIDDIGTVIELPGNSERIEVEERGYDRRDPDNDSAWMLFNENPESPLILYEEGFS